MHAANNEYGYSGIAMRLCKDNWMQRVKDDGKRSQIDETFYPRSFTGEMQNHSYAAGY